MDRHRAGNDGTTPSRQPAPHDQLVSAAQLLHKGAQRRPVIAVVGVSHDDVFPARALYAAQDRCTVAAHGHVDDASTGLACCTLRTVGASVVSHDDLASNVEPLQGTQCFGDAGCQGLGLIEAGHQERELQLIATGGYVVHLISGSP